MNLTSLPRRFATLLIATIAVAFAPSIRAAEALEPVVATTVTEADATITEADWNVAFQRGQLTAIMAMSEMMAFPAGVRTNSLRAMAALSRMYASIMGSPLGVAFFAGRAEVFEAAADFYGEPPTP